MTSKLSDNAIKSSHFAVVSSGIQLVPAIQRRISDVIAFQTWNEVVSNGKNEAFPVAVEDLSISSKTAAELGLENKEVVYCKLQLVIEGSSRTEVTTVSSTQDTDWFMWKLERAGEYRIRGNEAFKHENYSSAVRLYKRALAWLESPRTESETSLETNVPYSENELQHVNPIAVACYVNMATCYSKLHRVGDVDRCIAAASSALALDNAHVKARYRRSQAYVSSKEFDLALADLTKLRELEPNNKLFHSAMAKAQSAKTKFRKKQQDAYATLLNKHIDHR
ncbi:unnamed protein product [Peronospora belbahrii]|uniref:peptidylprolyl isomerase n=1 Tax=Peronospora belbahrii TaxID=622444 RepID=A0AAU9LB66_9STRA|nr:unnamed protein product [Peronospora belbahrii]